MKRHPTALVLVRSRGRILLVRRATAPEKGFWAPPAGHVEPGETARAAAQRECDEEVGAGAVRVGRFLFAFSHDIKLGHRHDAHIFAGTIADARKLRAGSDAAALRWCSLAELRSLEAKKRIELTHYTKQALNQLSSGAIKAKLLKGRWR